MNRYFKIMLILLIVPAMLLFTSCDPDKGKENPSQVDPNKAPVVEMKRLIDEEAYAKLPEMTIEDYAAFKEVINLYNDAFNHDNGYNPVTFRENHFIVIANEDKSDRLTQLLGLTVDISANSTLMEEAVYRVVDGNAQKLEMIIDMHMENAEMTMQNKYAKNGKDIPVENDDVSGSEFDDFRAIAPLFIDYLEESDYATVNTVAIKDGNKVVIEHEGYKTEDYKDVSVAIKSGDKIDVIVCGNSGMIIFNGKRVTDDLLNDMRTETIEYNIYDEKYETMSYFDYLSSIIRSQDCFKLEGNIASRFRPEE